MALLDCNGVPRRRWNDNDDQTIHEVYGDEQYVFRAMAALGHHCEFADLRINDQRTVLGLAELFKQQLVRDSETFES